MLFARSQAPLLRGAIAAVIRTIATKRLFLADVHALSFGAIQAVLGYTSSTVGYVYILFLV